MSGDSLSIKKHQLEEVADEIRELLNEADEEHVDAISRGFIFDNILPQIESTAEMIRSVDYLLSHDTSNETFHRQISDVFLTQDPLAKQLIAQLKFPVALRKMWSGGDVQDWIDSTIKSYVESQNTFWFIDVIEPDTKEELLFNPPQLVTKINDKDNLGNMFSQDTHFSSEKTAWMALIEHYRNLWAEYSKQYLSEIHSCVEGKSVLKNRELFLKYEDDETVKLQKEKELANAQEKYDAQVSLTNSLQDKSKVAEELLNTALSEYEMRYKE